MTPPPAGASSTAAAAALARSAVGSADVANAGGSSHTTTTSTTGGGIGVYGEDKHYVDGDGNPFDEDGADDDDDDDDDPPLLQSVRARPPPSKASFPAASTTTTTPFSFQLPLPTIRPLPPLPLSRQQQQLRPSMDSSVGAAAASTSSGTVGAADDGASTTGGTGPAGSPRAADETTPLLLISPHSPPRAGGASVFARSSARSSSYGGGGSSSADPSVYAASTTTPSSSAMTSPTSYHALGGFGDGGASAAWSRGASPLSRRSSTQYFFPSSSAARRLDSTETVASLVLRPQRRRSMLGAIGSSRRSRLYDEADDETLYREGNGLRVWYNDYTTIDWVHDYVKERVRIRKVRSVGGWRGWWTAKMDSMQAYVLIAIIGISAGTISSLVSITQLWLTDVKTGYCADGLFLRKKYCCPAAPPTLPIALLINGGDAASFLLRNGTTPDTPCDAWIPWEVAAGATATTRVLGIPAAQLVFMLGSATLALAAVLVVSLSATPSNGRYSDAAAAGVGGVKADVGGGAAGKKAKIVYHAAGSGVPQVKTILGGFVIRGFLGLRTMVVKSIALTLAVASGLCMGQQGPLVHISCCVGNVASRLFEKYATNEAKRREMMSAAAAAGVSVAFGAPIGGVLFSLEEVSYYFPSKTMWRSFICALVAAVTLKLINPFGRGKLVTYQVSYDHDWSGFELFPFLLIGLVGGAYGGWFVKASAQWAQMRQHFGAQKHPISEVLVISLLTAFLSYGSVLTRISNNELIGNLFSECNGDEDLRGLCRNMTLTDMMGTLCGILVLKIFLTFITLGIRVPSGVFGLSMVVGACGGRIVGMVMDNLQKNNPEHWLFRGCPADRDCIIPGVYAMVGAAAVLSGVTRMTVSLVVIMVELTGALTYVIPIMCAIMVAKWIADFIEPKSIYESQIRRNGYPYLDHKHEYHVKRRSRREGGRGTAGVVAVDVAERPSRRRADRGARGGAGGRGPGMRRGGVGTRADDWVECFAIERRYGRAEIEEKLMGLANSRWQEDGGFAVLYGHILVGYIAFNELNHAYNQIMKSQNINCRFYFRRPDGTDLDDLDLVVGGGGDGDDAVSDNAEEVDLTAFMDQAPLSVRSHTSMELVVELFIKLGVKTLCVVEDDGTFAGFIHKKRLIGWLLDEDLS